ncbi:MAG TPA: trigger factor [Bacteroidetes bacterium]|nr:trigger factor [Bacteroidota bacterium]
MSKVVRKDVDDLNATITVKVAKGDYEPKFNKELKKHRKEAQIKGFRKGKTPLSFIRKIYGQSVLVKIINELLEESINNYLVEEKLDIIGQPIPSETQERMEFSTKYLQDYEFNFDLGLAPVFEVKGASADTTVDKYKVLVLDDIVDKDLENARKRVGKNIKVEEGIQDGDLINFDVEELDGDQIKENGWAANFSILYDKIADEKIKTELRSKKLGDALRFNIYDLEADTDTDYVRKYLLDIPENEEQEVGQFFEAKIKEISRQEMADLDQEFLDKYFGEGVVSSVEDAKTKIKEGYEKIFDSQADALMFEDIKENLMAENKLALPEGFIKRWLKTVSQKNTDEVIAKDFERFKENLIWSLIVNKLAQQFELEVTNEDLLNAYSDRIRSYYGGYLTDEMIAESFKKFLEDEKQVQKLEEELINQKVFRALKEKLIINYIEISSDEFEKILKAKQAEQEALRNLPAEEDVSDLSEEEE